MQTKAKRPQSTHWESGCGRATPWGGERPKLEGTLQWSWRPLDTPLGSCKTGPSGPGQRGRQSRGRSWSASSSPGEGEGEGGHSCPQGASGKKASCPSHSASSSKNSSQGVGGGQQAWGTGTTKGPSLKPSRGLVFGSDRKAAPQLS